MPIVRETVAESRPSFDPTKCTVLVPVASTAVNDQLPPASVVAVPDASPETVITAAGVDEPVNVTVVVANADWSSGVVRDRFGATGAAGAAGAAGAGGADAGALEPDDDCAALHVGHVPDPPPNPGS